MIPGGTKAGAVEKSSQPSAEPSWLPVESVASGEHAATLVNIRLALGATSNKPMLVWTFKLDGGPELHLYTSKKGEGARKGYECAKALGLSRSFTHSEAVGRRCRVEVISDGRFDNITAVRPE